MDKDKIEEIDNLCRLHGCSEKIAKIHRAQFVDRGWMAHPPKAFCDWWEPTSFNSNTGASVGGHKEAWRKWVKPETKESRYYGIKSAQAYNTYGYREEFHEWLKDGMPEREPFDSTCAPKERVAEVMCAKRVFYFDVPSAC